MFSWNARQFSAVHILIASAVFAVVAAHPEVRQQIIDYFTRHHRVVFWEVSAGRCQ